MFSSRLSGFLFPSLSNIFAAIILAAVKSHLDKMASHIYERRWFQNFYFSIMDQIMNQGERKPMLPSFDKTVTGNPFDLDLRAMRQHSPDN